MKSPVGKFELNSFATADELARTVAEAWLNEIETTNRAGKPQCVALSGGRITQKFFASIVEQARARAASFARVHFFWADERCVPPDDPESNFKMASDLLFTPLKIPATQIHRLRGEESPNIAVKIAESELRQIAPSGPDGHPVLDLIFLGMGEDGHVASLFPEASAEIVQWSTPFLAVENSPKPPPQRISLSYAAIAAAKQVWVLISGAGKEKALRESLDSSEETTKTPLGRVIQLRPKTRIFTEIRLN
ncbi:MAG TPA: 6-phosphogluconolactonase [Candidatus Saccharimonadales bacterium]|nr:6-phosphogluconolactonase [Candidatus Saccharimonadales bacterium]